MNRIIFSLVLILVSAGIALAAPPSTQPTRFVRYVQNADGSARLEVADAAYQNDAGVSVHLIGAVHIADHSFFAGLNESFDHYDALLYEMVKPREAVDMPAEVAAPVPQKGQPTTRRAKPPSLAWVGGMQRFLRDRLQLEYQMDGIDYDDRPNFVHADLDAQSFADMQAARGESMLTLMIRSAISTMAKDSAKADMQGMALLGAMFSPDQSRELKRVLAQQFADLDDMMDAMEGPDGSVIVTERNKVALRVLDQQIARGKKFIGIFYGAGHLKRMETSLKEMGFRKVGETWRTAWEIGPPVVRPTTQKKS